jgi:putative ABC transport system ATP-binding protein
MEIRISHLDFAYPRRTFRLRIPELRVDRGGRAAFIGPSGSGKTTLLRLMAGLSLPDAGKVEMDGVAVSELREAERREFRITRIGFVFQDFQLVEYLNVEENIRLPFRIHRSMQWSGAVGRRLRELADAMEIGEKLSRRLHELSQGEKQRVAICRALLVEPRLVLADEPTGNLDPENKRRIMTILRDETSRREATLVMVTHDRDLLEGFDQVVDFQQFHSAALR